MAASDMFFSLDAQITAARREWESERQTLEQRILSLETELTITKEELERAAKARDDSFVKTAALLERFSIVAEVFREAHELVLAAGLHMKATNGGEASKETFVPAEGEPK